MKRNFSLIILFALTQSAPGFCEGFFGKLKTPKISTPARAPKFPSINAGMPNITLPGATNIMNVSLKQIGGYDPVELHRLGLHAKGIPLYEEYTQYIEALIAADINQQNAFETFFQEFQESPEEMNRLIYKVDSVPSTSSVTGNHRVAVNYPTVINLSFEGTPTFGEGGRLTSLKVKAAEIYLPSQKRFFISSFKLDTNGRVMSETTVGGRECLDCHDSSGFESHQIWGGDPDNPFNPPKHPLSDGFVLKFTNTWGN